MPYKDPGVQKAYQLEWMKNRRLQWIAENGPCVDCGTQEKLTVDHADASQKISHRVWSWAKERREAELAKCVVRCWPCHLIKTRESGERPRGEKNGRSVLTAEQVAEVRRRAETGESLAAIGRGFNVDRKHVWDLVHRRSRIYE